MFTSCTSSSREPVASFNKLGGSQETPGVRRLEDQREGTPVVCHTGCRLCLWGAWLDVSWEQTWWVGWGGVGMRMPFSPEDLILQLLELPLPGGNVDDQRILLLLQLGTLLPNHNAQQLGFQALTRPRYRVRVPCLWPLHLPPFQTAQDPLLCCPAQAWLSPCISYTLQPTQLHPSRSPHLPVP